MIKYYGSKYRVEGKEYPDNCIREFRSSAESLDGREQEKVRPGAKCGYE